MQSVTGCRPDRFTWFELSKAKLRNHQLQRRGAVQDHQLRAAGKRQEQLEITQGKHRTFLPQQQQRRNRELLALPLLPTDKDCPANLKELHSDKQMSESTLEGDI